MERETVGLLHPGEMGVSLAATALNGGHRVLWASAGRSQATHARASRWLLEDAGTLESLVRQCGILVSVCPPHAAEAVAEQVLAAGYRGLFLDANAISPMRMAGIGRRMSAAGVTPVDGGIIGGPAWEPGTTWLYLAGVPEATQRIVNCLAAGPMQVSVVGEEVGSSSALKACYAAYTKGTTALLAAILATAERLGVQPELLAQWARDWPGMETQAPNRVRGVTAKAWRFAGEMEEISATFAAAGLPGGFHASAAEVYRRLARFKGAAERPALEEVLAALLEDAGPAPV